MEGKEENFRRSNEGGLVVSQKKRRETSSKETMKRRQVAGQAPRLKESRKKKRGPSPKQRRDERGASRHRLRVYLVLTLKIHGRGWLEAAEWRHSVQDLRGDC